MKQTKTKIKNLINNKSATITVEFEAYTQSFEYSIQVYNADGTPCVQYSGRDKSTKAQALSDAQSFLVQFGGK